MKIAVLTTETTHHSWFCKKLKEHYSDVCVVIEKDTITPKFDIFHSFETDRLEYEKKYFFQGNYLPISNFCDVLEVKNINDSIAVDFLLNKNVQAVVTFGTRKITSDLLSAFTNRIINLHGGDPEYYRGLDSHLWAVYHEDWSSLVTTLHVLNAQLDGGKIIQKYSLDLSRVDSLKKLRSLNTEACLYLVLSALKSYELFGYFISSNQKKIGRYYSFMPRDLKELCVNKFNNFFAKGV